VAGLVGLSGAVGVKDFALVTNESKQEVAQIHFQTLVVNIVKGNIQNKSQDQVIYFDCSFWYNFI